MILSCGSRLRNTQQVCKVRRKLKMKQGGDCQLAEAIELCKTGLSGSGEDFVKLHRNPCVYLLLIDN